MRKRKLFVLGAAGLVAMGLASSAQAVDTLINDFSGGVTAANGPEGAGVYGTWYDSTHNTFGTPSASTLNSSAAMQIDDAGFGNGVYAIYQNAVPTTGTFYLKVDMHITEDADALNGIQAYQLGAQVGATAVHRPAGSPSLLAALPYFGNYQGLTSGDDTGLPVQSVATTSFSANMGDDLLVGLGTDVTTGNWNANSGFWSNGGSQDTRVRVDNIVLATPPTTGNVVINEFAYDDTGTDTAEFIELYNADSVPVDISNWTITGIDTAGSADVTITIPAGTILDQGDYYVAGMAGVPNLDLDITALSDFQNDMESFTVRDSSNAIIDSLVIERNKGNVIIPVGLGEPPFDGVSATSGGGYWGNTTTSDLAGALNLGTDPSFGSFTIGRVTDGHDTDDNGADFIAAVASPGAANNSSGTVTTFPYSQNFDGLTSGTYTFDLPGTFVSARSADPGIAEAPGIGAVNPSVIPSSPQGGNVAVMWDSSGGGNMNILNATQARQNLQLEAYVYIEATPLTGADTETWAIVIGGSDMLYNTGSFNGDYGVRALYVRDSAGATVTLQEASNGTSTNIGSALAIGTSGWYRLLIQVLDNGETGLRIGGTYGDNGATATHFSDGVTTLTGATLVSFGYREAITTGVVGARPLTIDDLTVRISTGSLATPSGVSDWSVLNN